MQQSRDRLDRAQTYNSSYVWLPMLPRSGGHGFEIVHAPAWRPRDFVGKSGAFLAMPAGGSSPESRDVSMQSGGDLPQPADDTGSAGNAPPMPEGPYKDPHVYTDGERP